MVQTASTSSALVAFLALSTAWSESVTALPTHRSSSAITRRAHIAAHHDPALLLNKRTNLGDHSVYIDASTANPGTTGGMRNSTVNLTIVSNKHKRDSTLSTLSRAMRSLFRRSTSSSDVHEEVSDPSTVVPPTMIALPLHTAAPFTQGHRTSRRQHQAAAAISRRAKRSLASDSYPVAPRIGVVVPPRTPRPKNVKRSQKLANTKRQNYDAANEQASIYAAAVAAIETSSSAAPVSPKVTAAPVNNFAAQDSIPPPPITVTMTLVPEGPHGEYINAAAIVPTVVPPSPASPSPTTLSEKLRQRRSTFAERTSASNRQVQDTSRLKRHINPKSGTVSTIASPTRVNDEAEPPQWTAIAHF
ncbi:uncharacterized protein JCM15063_002924 [Sporobolomyces koalae]|uniref:uncharacterized protein n=1 Tax=Sporobolomyces koalae TaxID=500713 RepID=UPI003171BB64